MLKVAADGAADVHLFDFSELQTSATGRMEIASDNECQDQRRSDHGPLQHSVLMACIVAR